MSLQVNPSSRRDRSRSPGHRNSDRDRSRGRRPEPDLITMEPVEMPSLPAGYSYDYDEYGGSSDPRGPSHDVNSHRDSYRIASPTQESSYYRQGNSENDAYIRRGEKDKSPIEHLKRGAEALLPPKYAAKLREVSAEREQKKEIKKEKLESDLAYGSTPPLASPKPSISDAVPPGLYAKPQQYEYDRPDEKLSYSSSSYRTDSYGADPRSSDPNVVTADPTRRSSRRGRSPLPLHARVSSLAVNTGNHSASSSLSVNTGHTVTPHHSASSSLAVNTGFHSASQSLSSAPPSPLQEAYHGTYQSLSPMPSPLLLASNGRSSADLLEPLSPSGLSDSEASEKKRRRARFHDPVDDAARLAQALKGDRHPPDTEPLIEILPGMTHEQLMELRAEYKRLVKAGPEHKGVNVAKHIRARLRDEDPSLTKACYATALGRWESEAYWANFWYQGDKTRRELLIESLMGRPNAEVRAIRGAFHDKKYGDSLARCMRTELKEDKFKRAVLLALEERRMEDRDGYGRPAPLDFDLVRADVETLYRAVRAEKGGETAMIQVVVLRSDAHLREVLRFYEKSFHSNFARDMLRKSGNLVGEVLAHILNGVINKPVRDAMLLNHALKEASSSSSSSSSSSRSSKDRDGLRRDLLTSRLVRYHWDRHHMAAVKRAYRDRYGQELADAVREGTSGQWGLFCQQLVVTRTPDDVKKFESVEIIRDVRKEDRDPDREREKRERHYSGGGRHGGERDSDREREREKEREWEREKEKEKERGREKRYSSGASSRLEVRGGGRHGTRDRSRSRSRERSRSRSQRRE